MADLIVHGRPGDSVFLLRPGSPAGETWIEEHVSEDCTYLGDSIAVEHRYIGPIIEGASADGLVVGNRT